jgi:hypothetical protein
MDINSLDIDATFTSSFLNRHPNTLGIEMQPSYDPADDSLAMAGYISTRKAVT